MLATRKCSFIKVNVAWRGVAWRAFDDARELQRDGAGPVVLMGGEDKTPVLL